VNIRNRALPEGWYPSTGEEIRRLISAWGLKLNSGDETDGILAGIVPHAGWDFCGPIIAEVLGTFGKSPDTIVVLGGHNPPGAEIIEYSEDIWNLPSGPLARDSDLVERVNRLLPDSLIPRAENSGDNTVEVILPLIAVLYPDVKWAAWRLPADENSLLFGDILAEAAMESARRVVVIGSTDLTHYGPNYGYMPSDSLTSSLNWVKKNDEKILRALAGFQGEKALELARRDKSACSAGAAAGAMTFARKLGCSAGRILHYSTSHDVYPSSSFVGYGSIIWGLP